MALEIRQQLRLTQQLIMTPQLQQALKILQMPRLELNNAIQVELRENPVLEDVVGLPEEEWDSSSPGLGGATLSKESLPKEISLEKFPWDYSSVPYHDVPQHEEDEDRPSWEQTLYRPESLTDYLIWQLRLSDLEGKARRIGLEIIGNLGADGYLQGDLAALAAQCDATVEEMETVLRRIQEFDPPGIAARDLRECLLIQVRHMGMEGTLAERIIRECLAELENNRIPQIARKLGVDVGEVAQAVEWIRGLEPKPGRLYGTEEAQYITPDVFVFKLQDDYVIVLNEDGLPKLRVSPFYMRSLANKELPREARTYIQEKIRSALWLIRSIHQRQRTIYKVTESIMRFQREFLDKGIDYLRPLVLRDVALDTGLSESTISRVVTNKYAHTPQGLYELKFFFNSSIAKANGEAVASQSVKEQIKRLVQKEDPQNPLSDQEIVEILGRQGIHIARRTVAKYRNELGVLPSNKRRKLF
ncbi:MAG: RNA polymerase factor sigma-54 [Thermodesulfobacteriota bacterium]